MQTLSSASCSRIIHGRRTDLHVYGHCGPRECVTQSSSESELVGNEKVCSLRMICDLIQECTVLRTGW